MHKSKNLKSNQSSSSGGGGSAFDFLKSFDIFGFKFNILYKGQESYKTNFGGVTTIVSIMLVIVSLMYFAQNFIHKTNPRISSKEMPLGEAETFHFKNTNSFFAFRVDGLDPNEILSNKWFHTEAYAQEHIGEDEKGNSLFYRQNLSLINCTDILMNFETVSIFSSIQGDFLTQNLCLNLTVDEQTNTYKEYNENNFKLLIGPSNSSHIIKNFSLKAKKNIEFHLKLTCGLKNHEGVNCLFDKEFEKKFKRKNFFFTFIDTTPDFDNNSNPFYRFLENDFMFVNPYLGKYIDLLYSNVAIDSDFGILFSSSEGQSSLELDRLMHNYIINSQNKDYDKNDVNIIHTTLRFSENLKYYKRVYYKLQHVFSEVGGIINGILLLGRIVVLIFSKPFFYESLINDYFNNYLENQGDLNGKRNIIGYNKSYIKKPSSGRDRRDNRHRSRDVEDFDRKNEGNGDDNRDKTKKQRRDKSQSDQYDRNDRDKNLKKYELGLDTSKDKDHGEKPIRKNRKKSVAIKRSDSKQKSKSPMIKGEFNKNSYSSTNNQKNSFDNPLFSNRSNLFLNDKEKGNNTKNTREIRINESNEVSNSLNKITIQDSVLSDNLLNLEISNKNNNPGSTTKENLQIKNRQQNNNELMTKDNIESNSIKEKTENETDKKNQKNNFKAIMEKKVGISFKSILLTLMCPSKCHSQEIKKNNEAYQKFQAKLNKLLELDNILNSNKNIELIKTLFFNETQRLALDYVKFEYAAVNKEKDIEREIEIVKSYFLKKEGAFEKQDIKILEVLNNEIFQFKFFC